jgi:hypothetical protein
MLLSALEYQQKLQQLHLITPSGFMPSTLQFWHEQDSLHFFEPTSGALLVAYSKPAFGKPYGALACMQPDNALLQNSLICLRSVGIEKLRVSCNLSQFHPLTSFRLVPEPDEAEYVYELSNLSALKGHLYKKQRNAVSRAQRSLQEHTFETHLLSGYENISELEKFCEEITTLKVQSQETFTENLEREMHALKRCLQMRKMFNLQLCVIIKEETWHAAMILEADGSNWITGHFLKAKDGLGVYMLHRMAGEFINRGYRYFNFQEDRGVPSLRYFKQQLNPSAYIQSYQVINI